MVFNISTKKFYFTLLFLFFFVTTISMVTTSLISRIIIEQARIISIGLLAFGLFVSLFVTKINRQNLFSSIFIVSFFSYGYLLSLIYGGLVNSIQTLTAIIIIFMGTYLLSSSDLKENQYRLAKWFIYYAIIVLFITYVTNGLVFLPVPEFVFEYSANVLEANASYNQGVSQFYGYSALATVSLFVTQNNKVKRNMLALLLLCFILLSLLGGARGDSIFALSIILIYLMYRLSFKFFFKVLTVIILVVIILSNVINISDIVIFQRLEALSGGFGSREILFSQSLELLFDNSSCVIHGCGFGFFQSYYDYHLGFYPHNLIVELIIVFGLPLTIIMLAMCFKGFFKFFKIYGQVDLIGLFFTYAFFLGLKSGSLNTSWLFMTFFVYFISLYVLEKWIFSLKY